MLRSSKSSDSMRTHYNSKPQIGVPVHQINKDLRWRETTTTTMFVPLVWWDIMQSTETPSRLLEDSRSFTDPVVAHAYGALQLKFFVLLSCSITSLENWVTPPFQPPAASPSPSSLLTQRSDPIRKPRR